MKRRFADKKSACRLRELAILENHDGTYEYMQWHKDKKTGRLSWIKGNARILGDVLALESITAEGAEESFQTVKETRKALKKLPAWQGITNYYCVLIGRQASLINHCASGKPLDKNDQEFVKQKAAFRQHGIVLL
jgi:hypothetical protein